MQAQARVILSLLLVSFAVELFAQTSEVANPLPGSNSEADAAIRRRFERVRSESLAATNATVAPSFPSFPAVPPLRRRVTNEAGVVSIVTELPSQASPASQAGAPAAQVVPGTDRTSIPMPGQPGAQPGFTAPADGALAGQPGIINPAFNPDDPIEAGMIDLNNMPLEQFLEVYAGYSGRTILRPVTLPAVVLTLRAQTDLTRREVVEAMNGVLALNGITTIPMGDKFVKAVPSNLADREGGPISDEPVDELPMAEQFITRIVKLKTAKPSEIAPHLQSLAKTPTAVTPIDSNQTLILRDYSSNIKRMLEVIDRIDVMPESDFTLEVIPIRYGKVGDIYSTMNALISGVGGGGASVGAGAVTGGASGMMGRGFGGGMGGGRTGGFGGMGTSRMGGGGYGGGGYRGGSGYGGNYGGGYYPQQLEGEVIPQQVAPAPSPGASQSSFQGRLNQIINRAANPDEVKLLENAQIVPDERSNKLLIFANKRDMAMITNLVSKVDVLLAQVLIEAVILEVSLGDSRNMGVSMAQHPRQWGQDLRGAGAVNSGQLFGTLTNFPAGTPEGFSYFATINDDFDVAIQAIARDSEIKIVSRPRIHTSHAMPGSFFIGETVPYVTGSYDYGYIGAGTTSRSIVNEKMVGLTLVVVPIITPEGMVIMEISQIFDQRGQDVIIDGNPIPLVNSRSAESFLTVRNGDMIMLGGFISETRSNAKNGVPFLKDIPGLGVLFRSSAKSNTRTELIMLIKATVLDSPEEAAFLAESERLMLPGVRRAEQEFEESEAKRLRQVERRRR